jgi:hypothetical protein
MHRCSSGFLTLSISIAFTLALTGCLGKSSGNSGSGSVETVTLSPTSMLSIDVGATQVFSATAKNATGGTVLGADIQFIVSSGSPNTPAPLSITNSGNACAGTWDPTGAFCSQGTPGIAIVTAVTGGVSSPQTIVYVHQHIDSLQIKNAESQPPLHDCFSQGETWQFQGIAYSNGTDITSTVGPLNWSFTNGGVVTEATTVPGLVPPLLPNQVQTTAKSPGITNLLANVSGTTSSAYPYTTCLIQAIYLQIGGQGQGGQSITVNNGGSVPITATAIDTLYPFTHNTLTAPPLTWSTTNPEVAAFTTTTSTSTTNSASARANLGGATLTASCSPPSCNIGVFPGLPIYASSGTLPNGTTGYGAISVNVTSTTAAPTYTGWATTSGCADAPGCSSALFSVTPSTTNPIGAIVSLPWTPNSMMFNHASSPRLYIGSDVGLMYVDVTASNPTVTLISNSTTPCNVALCGRVLAISNDGKLVVVSDTVSTPSQVYIFNGGSTTTAPIDLILSNPGEIATAAAFSPDQLKLFILTNDGKMYIYSTVDALTSVPVATSVTDVKFSADGSFVYVAGNPAPGNTISGYATCDGLPTHHDPLTMTFDFVTTSGIPTQIFPSPDAQHVFALDPPNGSVDVFTTEEKRNPLPDGQFICTAPPPFDIDPIVNFPQSAQAFDLGQGKNFLPIYSQLVADGRYMIIVARGIPAVLVFNVSNGTTSSVPLSNPLGGSTDPLAASASTDGSQVYIAACDQYVPNSNPPVCAVGSVHMVNTCAALSCVAPPATGEGDFQDVPYVNVNDNNNPNMCSNLGAGAPLCLPNLIAIRPQ